jgi:hypothetical protein
MAATTKRAAVFIGGIYGALVLFAAAPMYLFSAQQAQPLFLKVAGGLYTLTLLPAAICAIWFKRIGGIWMIAVSALGAIALCSQEIARYHRSDGPLALGASLLWWLFVAAIPAAIGGVILKHDRPN